MPVQQQPKAKAPPGAPYANPMMYTLIICLYLQITLVTRPPVAATLGYPPHGKVMQHRNASPDDIAKMNTLTISATCASSVTGYLHDNPELMLYTSIVLQILGPEDSYVGGSPLSTSVHPKSIPAEQHSDTTHSRRTSNNLREPPRCRYTEDARSTPEGPPPGNLQVLLCNCMRVHIPSIEYIIHQGFKYPILKVQYETKHRWQSDPLCRQSKHYDLWLYIVNNTWCKNNPHTVSYTVPIYTNVFKVDFELCSVPHEAKNCDLFCTNVLYMHYICIFRTLDPVPMVRISNYTQESMFMSDRALSVEVATYYSDLDTDHPYVVTTRVHIYTTKAGIRRDPHSPERLTNIYDTCYTIYWHSKRIHYIRVTYTIPLTHDICIDQCTLCPVPINFYMRLLEYDIPRLRAYLYGQSSRIYRDNVPIRLYYIYMTNNHYFEYYIRLLNTFDYEYSINVTILDDERLCIFCYNLCNIYSCTYKMYFVILRYMSNLIKIHEFGITDNTLRCDDDVPNMLCTNIFYIYIFRLSEPVHRLCYPTILRAKNELLATMPREMVDTRHMKSPRVYSNCYTGATPFGLQRHSPAVGLRSLVSPIDLMTRYAEDPYPVIVYSYMKYYHLTPDIYCLLIYDIVCYNIICYLTHEKYFTEQSHSRSPIGRNADVCHYTTIYAQLFTYYPFIHSPIRDSKMALLYVNVTRVLVLIILDIYYDEIIEYSLEYPELLKISYVYLPYIISYLTTACRLYRTHVIMIYCILPISYVRLKMCRFNLPWPVIYLYCLFRHLESITDEFTSYSMRDEKITSYKCLRDDLGICASYATTEYYVATLQTILLVPTTTGVLRESAALIRRCNTLPCAELNKNSDYICLGMVFKTSCIHYVMNTEFYGTPIKLWVDHLVYPGCKCISMYPPGREYQYSVYYVMLVELSCDNLVETMILGEFILSRTGTPQKRTHTCKVS